MYLDETDILTKYDEDTDSLLLISFYRNPKGRVLRKLWSNPWKVLPNIENWIKFFKNNKIN